MDRETGSTTPTERDANARLIAAAPELLEACKRMLAVIESARRIACSEPAMANALVTELQTCGGAIVCAEDAIAKAEGSAAE